MRLNISILIGLYSLLTCCTASPTYSPRAPLPFGFVLSPREESQLAYGTFKVDPPSARRPLLGSAFSSGRRTLPLVFRKLDSDPHRDTPASRFPIGTERISSDDPRLSFLPRNAWERVRGPDFLTGSAHRTTPVAHLASFHLVFEGTGIEWMGSQSPHHGQAEVWLDGELVQTVDAHSTRWMNRRVIASVRYLDFGKHSVEVVQLDAKQIDVDALIIIGDQ